MADDWVEQTGNNAFNSTTCLATRSLGTRTSIRLQAARVQAARQRSRTTSDCCFLRSQRCDNRARDGHHSSISRSLDLPGTGTFQQKVESCNGQMAEIGDTFSVMTTPTTTLTAQALDTVWTRDPYPPATWNNSQTRVDNSCAPGCAPISPRMMPIALFDPRRFQLGRALSRPTGRVRTSAVRPTIHALPSRTSSASSSTAWPRGRAMASDAARPFHEVPGHDLLDRSPSVRRRRVLARNNQFG